MIFKFEGTVNWMGCDEIFLIEAEDEAEATRMAEERWNETVSACVESQGEATEDDIEEYGVE